MRSIAAASALSSTTSTRRRGEASARSAVGRLLLVASGRNERQPHDELAAVPQTFALRLDRTAMKPDQLAAQREPDAEPAATDERAVLGHLPEHLEHAFDALLRNAEALVLDTHDAPRRPLAPHAP